MNTKLDLAYFCPKVLQVIPRDDFTVVIYFNDGSVRLFDIKPLIKSGTVFEPLQNIEFFKSKITVINGTVAWDIGGNKNPRKCLDLDPFILFEQPMISDPLKEMIQ